MTTLRLLIAAGLLPASVPVPGQVHPDFSINARLVIVPVTVTDHRGAFVNGLSRASFAIAEDGVAQQIRSFSEDDAPVSIGVVMDLSGSMRNLTGWEAEALRAFAMTSNPGDEAFLNTVSTRPRQGAGFSGNLDAVINGVAFAGASGSTALIDTIWLSLSELRAGRHARKALLVISDGMDNHSRYSRTELLNRAMEADAQIYAVCIFNAPRNAKPIELVEPQRGMALLAELAQSTGGMDYVIRDRDGIQGTMTSISRGLRNQYNIGFIPANAALDGRWRRIQVRVAGNGLKAHARAGYRRD